MKWYCGGVEMKYCPRCGTALQDDNQFCYRCGLKQQDWRQVSGGEAPPSQQQDTSAGQAEVNQGTGASSQSGEKTEAHWTTNGQWPKPPSSGPWYQQSGGNSSGPHPSGQWTGGAQNQGQWAQWFPEPGAMAWRFPESGAMVVWGFPESRTAVWRLPKSGRMGSRQCRAGRILDRGRLCSQSGK